MSDQSTKITELDDIRESLDASERAAAVRDNALQVHHLREAILAAIALDDRLRIRVADAGRVRGMSERAARTVTMLNDFRNVAHDLLDGLDGPTADPSDDADVTESIEMGRLSVEAVRGYAESLEGFWEIAEEVCAIDTAAASAASAAVVQYLRENR